MVVFERKNNKTDGKHLHGNFPPMEWFWIIANNSLKVDPPSVLLVPKYYIFKNFDFDF